VNSLLALSLGAILLTACASKTREQQTALRASLEKKDYAKAKEIISDPEFLSDKNNTLLKMMERGRTFFLAKDYYQALNEFNKARDLSEELFTVSMSKKASSAVVNDNADNYYGESYEKSLIRYYQSLTHHMLSVEETYEAHTILEKGADDKLVSRVIPEKKLSASEINFHRNASKNVLIDWDSYLSSLKSTTGGKVTYKDDLLAKLYGAYIHQSAGSNTDVQIAKDLYRSAKKVLLKNYNIYSSFNAKFSDFRKNFSKLAEMPLSEVEEKFIVQTKNNKELQSFIDQQLASLEKGKPNNVLFVVEDGFVQEKVVKKIDFPLADSKNGRQLASMDGGFVNFTTNILKLSAGAVPKIYFELPEIPYRPASNSTTLIVQSVDGKITKELPLYIVDPMDEIANQALDERSTSLYVKTGARVAGKHLAALLSAYTIYQQTKDKGEMIAMTAATFAYSAANKAIEASERADLRSWRSLPQNFLLSSGRLPAGEYKISMKENGTVTPMKDIKVNKVARNIINLQK